MNRAQENYENYEDYNIEQARGLDQQLNKIADQITKECKHGMSKFPKFNSYHEGYAIIKEELDELWDEIKKYPKHDIKKLQKETLQVGAMAIRFYYDLLTNIKEAKNEQPK